MWSRRADKELVVAGVVAGERGAAGCGGVGEDDLVAA
jgi:hypothetical protein